MDPGHVRCSVPGGAARVGHRLIEDDGAHVNAQTAISLNDVSVSQVDYHTVTAESPQLWLTFQGQINQPLNVQLGVRKIGRMEAYRPAFAILGPGLPPVTVPLLIPEGYGGWVFTTDDITVPEAFYEPFTGTRSWVFPEQDYVLLETGRFYIVAYVSSEETGKLWIAIGKKESFTIVDIWNMPNIVSRVRRFHEVGPVGGILFWVSLPVRLFRLLFCL